ncbi:MAG: hypothetical protein JO019_01220 [Candidatus Kaiserbacteria bacterium]|nr:hypothetical protein [Candidatus Kaiserbacteria bacterium]
MARSTEEPAGNASSTPLFVALPFALTLFVVLEWPWIAWAMPATDQYVKTIAASMSHLF